jgi:thiamine monophosphate synthase
VIFGTVFPSRSKPSDAPVAGLDLLRLTVASAPCRYWPLAASRRLGRACHAAGAAGVAAIGVFFRLAAGPTLGPAEAMLAFRRAWNVPNL